MRPFFSYYGAKYKASAYLGAPRRDTVIEPFAGSAAYSTRWNVRDARLYDVSPDICDLWDFLINCSIGDIERIPDSFEDMEQVSALSRGANLLVRFWAAKGRHAATNKLSPWYFQWRSSSACWVWSPAVKRRICEQKPLISGWTINQADYKDVPMVEAHWHIDPPYNNGPGKLYPFSSVDHASIAAWAKSLPGDVDVCENAGAEWLDFQPLCDVVSSRGRRSGAVSREVVWRKYGNAVYKPNGED